MFEVSKKESLATDLLYTDTSVVLARYSRSNSFHGGDDSRKVILLNGQEILPPTSQIS